MYVEAGTRGTSNSHSYSFRGAPAPVIVLARARACTPSQGGARFGASERNIIVSFENARGGSAERVVCFKYGTGYPRITGCAFRSFPRYRVLPLNVLVAAHGRAKLFRNVAVHNRLLQRGNYDGTLSQHSILPRFHATDSANECVTALSANFEFLIITMSIARDPVKCVTADSTEYFALIACVTVSLGFLSSDLSMFAETFLGTPAAQRRDCRISGGTRREKCDNHADNFVYMINWVRSRV